VLDIACPPLTGNQGDDVRRSRSIVFAAVALTVVAMFATGGGGVAGAAAGFETQARPFLVPLADGVTVQPIFTTGDIVGDYQMSGVPDGIGWIDNGDGTIEVYFNHELHPAYDPSGARVSHLTISTDGSVLSGEYLVDGTEGYEWFCSSTLEIVDGIPWYTTGEESKHSDRYGTSIAIDTTTGDVHETPWFGHFGHENVVPVQDLAKAFMGLSEDGFSEYSQYYAYTAPTFDDAIFGTDGSLRVFVPNKKLDGNPSDDDISTGETVKGTFERVPNARNLLPLKLEKTVQSMDAMDFNRIEDQIDDPNAPGTMYFAETGRANQESVHGRVYRLVIDPTDPTKARLTLLLDGDDGDDIFSPDNLGISATTLMIQEDRNWKKSGYNRVLAYDLASGSLTAVARTDPDQSIVDEKGPGAWESSGIVSVADVFGEGYWLLNVQAHYTEMPVPDTTLVPDSATGEGGQLELVYVQGT
jgi:hypothetical protein